MWKEAHEYPTAVSAVDEIASVLSACVWLCWCLCLAMLVLVFGYAGAIARLQLAFIC